MYFHLSILLCALLSGVHSSPAPLPEAYSVIPASCTAIASIYPTASAASSFCASYLGITTSKTTTTVTSTAEPVTVTATDASTSIVFLSGNPPAAASSTSLAARDLDERNNCNHDNCYRNLVDARYSKEASSFCATYTQTVNTEASAIPSYIKNCANSPSRVSSACSCAFPTSSSTHPASYTSSACSCLSLATATTKTLTSTTTPTTTVSIITSTVYPCATTASGSLPSPGPAYGKYQTSSNTTLSLENTLYYLSTTPEGATAESCCNACYFELENCVQAWWYFYEGCVVSQATDLSSASGEGVSSVCPSGLFEGLEYVEDYDPAFRSTGDIAGPCGMGYSNI